MYRVRYFEKKGEMDIKLKMEIYLQASDVPLPEKIWAPIPTKLDSTTSIKPSHTENHHTDTKGQETGKNHKSLF